MTLSFKIIIKKIVRCTGEGIDAFQTNVQIPSQRRLSLHIREFLSSGSYRPFSQGYVTATSLGLFQHMEIGNLRGDKSDFGVHLQLFIQPFTKTNTQTNIYLGFPMDQTQF